MCLDYVAKHEQHLQSELEQYLAEDSSHRGVLDTWFEEAVEVPSAPLLAENHKTLDVDSPQEVLDIALASNRTLQELYDQRAQHAVSSAERELFESLSGQNEAEIRRLVRNIQRLEDY
ncbi:MAG: 2-hydroxyacyl-CoA dehydratase [Granulosicoccus sp.]|nr:2-hydroxyacyl-CoA dehydratase [Granulosicoccus sp.]